MKELLIAACVLITLRTYSVHYVQTHSNITYDPQESVLAIGIILLVAVVLGLFK
jgi:hypothetical protein